MSSTEGDFSEIDKREAESDGQEQVDISGHFAPKRSRTHRFEFNHSTTVANPTSPRSRPRNNGKRPSTLADFIILQNERDLKKHDKNIQSLQYGQNKNEEKMKELANQTRKQGYEVEDMHRDMEFDRNDRFAFAHERNTQWAEMKKVRQEMENLEEEMAEMPKAVKTLREGLMKAQEGIIDTQAEMIKFQALMMKVQEGITKQNEDMAKQQEEMTKMRADMDEIKGYFDLIRENANVRARLHDVNHILARGPQG